MFFFFALSLSSFLQAEVFVCFFFTPLTSSRLQCSHSAFRHQLCLEKERKEGAELLFLASPFSQPSSK